MNHPIETHPFPAIMPAQATVMMTGSMPPRPDKWCMPFHYPNFYNDMWRIYGAVFFNDPQYFQVHGEQRFCPERITNFLFQRGIALVPSVKKAIREQGNAADKFLTVVETMDLSAVVQQLPQCQWIITTGGKATEIIMNLSHYTGKMPKTNQQISLNIDGRVLHLYRLPSTSRAYPLSLTKKIESYRAYFQKIGLIVEKKFHLE